MKNRRDGIGAGQRTRIVGFRLPEDMALDVKHEAARRGLKLNELFAEMWRHYEKYVAPDRI